VRQSGDCSNLPFDTQKLLRVSYVYGRYFICCHKDLNSEYEKPLLVLKALQFYQPDTYKFGYKLEEGTIIQLGYTRLLVKEICNTSDELNIPEKKSKPKNIIAECRICNGSESTTDDPLISPCKCSGTIKYVHINCMRYWNETRMDSRISLHSSSYTIKKFKCELCDYKYPIDFVKDGVKYSLVNIARPKSCPYVIFESLGDNYEKQIHIVTLSKVNALTIVPFN